MIGGSNIIKLPDIVDKTGVIPVSEKCFSLINPSVQNMIELFHKESIPQMRDVRRLSFGDKDMKRGE